MSQSTSQNNFIDHNETINYPTGSNNFFKKFASVAGGTSNNESMNLNVGVSASMNTETAVNEKRGPPGGIQFNHRILTTATQKQI